MARSMRKNVGRRGGGEEVVREVETERRRIKGRGEKWDGSAGGRWEGRVEEGESDD